MSHLSASICADKIQMDLGDAAEKKRSPTGIPMLGGTSIEGYF